MGIELKTVNPVVFDDTDKCSSVDDCCEYLFNGPMYCGLFNKNLKGHLAGYSKIKECKDHYLKNKTQ